MNFKRIGLGIILLVILGIAVLAYRGISFQHQHQFEVTASQSEVFKYLTDISYYPLWFDGFIRHEKIQGEFRRKGSQYNLFIEDEEQVFTVIETFEKVDSPVLIIKEHQHDFYTLETKFEITEKNDSLSNLQINQQIYGTRALENLLLPLYAHQVLSEHLQNYKKAFEVGENSGG